MTANEQAASPQSMMLGSSLTCIDDVNGDDVNGDGVSELVVGAEGFPSGGTRPSGAAFVVYGGAARFRPGATIDLTPLTDSAPAPQLGFRIDGEARTIANRGLGHAAANVGDVTGDGLAEIAIANRDGRVYVVTAGDGSPITGGADATTPDPRILFTIRGGSTSATGGPGDNLAVVGDVDGDGKRDLLVGKSTTALAGQPAGSGAAFVVSGAATGAVDVLAAEPSPYVLQTVHGSTENQHVGVTLANAGDVDGDDHDDLLIGELGAAGRGGAIVVLARAGSTVDGGAPGDVGYRIDGPADNAQLGVGLTAIPDVNGDGTPEHVLTTWRYPTIGGGTAFVIYGKRSDRSPVSTGDLTRDVGARYVAGTSASRISGPVSVAGPFEGQPAIALARRDGATVLRLAVPGTGDVDDDGSATATARVTWGFRGRFRNYVSAGDGKPPVAATAGAECDVHPNAAVGGCDPDKAQRWTPIGGAWDLDSGTAQIATSGTVTFSFPAHFFTLMLQDPQWTIADGQATVTARMKLDVVPNGIANYPSVDQVMTIGRFPLERGPVEADGTVSWQTGAGALTAEAATALGGFLPEGAELDPATIVVPTALGPLPEPEPEPEPTPTPLLPGGGNGTPSSSPAPTIPAARGAAPAAARVSRLTLTRRAISLRVSQAASLRIVVRRWETRRVRRNGRVRTVGRWRAARTVTTTTAARSRQLTRRFARPLAPGRYRVSVRTSRRGDAGTTVVTSTLTRRVR